MSMIHYDAVPEQEHVLDEAYLDALEQKVINLTKGKLPGLVVNVEDSQSEPWSLDMSSIPGFA